MKNPLLFIATALLFVGCATPTVVQTMKPGDDELTCGQLKNEYAEANRFIKEANEEKGWTGGNVARGLLFWPAILGTYNNANEALAAAETRKVNLMNLMRNKKYGSLDRLSLITLPLSNI